MRLGAAGSGEKPQGAHVAQGIDPPKTHNLLYLERLAPESVGEELTELDLESLTRWAIEGRYPDDLDEATASDAEAALATAAAVLHLVEAAIRRSSQEGA
ncbi:MAG: HEPN domain-containing protein [Egibacteraceae bacterium]